GTRDFHHHRDHRVTLNERPGALATRPAIDLKRERLVATRRAAERAIRERIDDPGRRLGLPAGPCPQLEPTIRQTIRSERGIGARGPDPRRGTARPRLAARDLREHPLEGPARAPQAIALAAQERLLERQSPILELADDRDLDQRALAARARLGG